MGSALRCRIPGEVRNNSRNHTSDERASEGSHPAHKVASPTVAANVSNATSRGRH
jgi:hypothetical protein